LSTLVAARALPTRQDSVRLHATFAQSPHRTAPPHGDWSQRRRTRQLVKK